MTRRAEDRGDGRRLSGGAIATLLGLAVLITFIVQNREPVPFDFITWQFSWPLWLYTIVTAVLGAFVWFGLGIVRRHRRRVERRRGR